MYPFLYGAIILVSVLALVGTLYVGKIVNHTSKVYEQEEDHGEKSLTYKSNPKHNSSFQLLTIIYLITFVITVILIAIFIL
ncbi:hypothetical protein ACFFGV_18375 [Pontibacillus salicampi]|uniref:DUF3899 domain-containing protein n=1 Tax=Pontibacillus salicampi TaxID=1449801 RepID=A0ABV6LTI0_9BACI